MTGRTQPDEALVERARYEVLRDHVARLSAHASLGAAVLADMDEAEQQRHRQAIADRLDARVSERAAQLAEQEADRG